MCGIQLVNCLCTTEGGDEEKREGGREEWLDEEDDGEGGRDVWTHGRKIVINNSVQGCSDASAMHSAAAAKSS